MMKRALFLLITFILIPWDTWSQTPRDLCQPPTIITVVDISTDSATITWTRGGTETAWELAVGNRVFYLNDTFYTVHSLDSNTTYNITVRAICDVGDTSIAASGIFHTPCYFLRSLPYFNDFESVRAQVTDKTCAILLETVQGEGGIYPADPGFLTSVRKLCDEKDILLILDEIQCGMGRTGHWFACEAYNVKPDIMTAAKALGCGIPVGAFVLNEKAAAKSLEAGDHGTTYGGNPLACAAVSTVFDIFDQEKIVEHVAQTAPYLEEKLDALVSEYSFLTQRRGMGFMQGIVVEGKPVGEIVRAALEEGLVILSAGSNVLRLVPPLIIEKEDIDEMVMKLERVLGRAG